MTASGSVALTNLVQTNIVSDPTVFSNYTEYSQQSSLGAPAANPGRAGAKEAKEAKDVAGTAHLFGVDEAGNNVQLTFHNRTAPLWLDDDDDPYPAISYADNSFLGGCRRFDPTQGIRQALRRRWRIC